MEQGEQQQLSRVNPTYDMGEDYDFGGDLSLATADVRKFYDHLGSSKVVGRRVALRNSLRNYSALVARSFNPYASVYASSGGVLRETSGENQGVVYDNFMDMNSDTDASVYSTSMASARDGAPSGAARPVRVKLLDSDVGDVEEGILQTTGL